MRSAMIRILGCWIALVCAGVSSVQAQFASDRIPWLQDLEQARQLAANSHRLVLIHVWSDNCIPCVRLDRNVFPQPEVIRAIGTNYVPVKVHAQQNPELVRRLRVNQWPTDVVITPDGRELYRDISQQEPHRYVMLLDQIASQYRTGVQHGRGPLATQQPPRYATGPSQQTNLPYQPPAGAPLAGDPAAQTPPGRGYSRPPDSRQSAYDPTNRDPADRDLANRDFANRAYNDPLNQQPIGRRAPVQPPYSQQYGEAATAPPPQQQDIRNPYIDQPMQGTEAGRTARENAPRADATGNNATGNNATGNNASGDNTSGENTSGENTSLPGTPRTRRTSRFQPANGAESAPLERAEPSGDGGADIESESGMRPDQTWQPESGPGVPENQASDAEPSESAVATTSPDTRSSPETRPRTSEVNVPPGSPPLGLAGYCPVSILVNERWIKGDARWGAVHRGRLYLFASPAEQEQFLRAPDRFSPMLAGYDVVRYFERGELVEGNRQHGLRLNDSIYLFADEDSLQQFHKNPKPYADRMKELMQRTGAAPIAR